VRAGAGVVGVLAGPVAAGVDDEGAAPGVAGWLPQPASMTGTTAIVSAIPAMVLRTGFMAASLGEAWQSWRLCRLSPSVQSAHQGG
jgi:hypothetical protein